MNTRKLVLKTETLRTLTDVEIGDVNGGTLSPVLTISVRVCTQSDKIARGAIAVGKGIKALHDHYKGAGGTQDSYAGGTGTIPSL